MRRFKVTLWNGESWSTGKYEANSAHGAARAFLSEHFPNAELFSLRWEQPASGLSTWSAGTSEHGQRVWIREQS